MRKPVKAMAYYELLSLRSPVLLVLLLLPAFALLLINFFFSEALPSSQSYNNTEMVPLDFRKLNGNLFNYYPADSATTAIAEAIFTRIREAQALQLTNHTITAQPPLVIYGFADEREFNVNKLFDVLNYTTIPLEVYLARYNVTYQEYFDLQYYFAPSLFSLQIQPGNISIGYNISYLERLNAYANESFTMLTYHKYYANRLGPFLQKLILEALGTQRFELHSYPSYQVIYSEFEKIDRASFQAASIVFFAAVTFFAARDRGREHRILRAMSLNEGVYWCVRAVSTICYAALSAALLVFVAYYYKIANFQRLTAETAVLLGAMLAITGSGGGMLLSALFGANSVVLPLIMSMLIGLVANFILEIIIYDILAGSSIYDKSLVPPIVATVLQFVDYSFSVYYALDRCSVGLATQMCRSQYDLQNLCYYALPSEGQYAVSAACQFCVYFALTLLIAYIKPEFGHPGRVFGCRHASVDNGLDIQELTHKYNSRNSVLHQLEFRPGAEFRAGLVGLSGAGKTTLLRILSGSLRPTRFNGSVYGYNLRRCKDLYALRRVVGYCPQDNSNVFFDFTVAQNMRVAGLIKGSMCDSDLLGLNAQLAQRASSLSGGQLRRLALLNAIQGANRLLIFDEITSGLDPLTCEAIDAFLRRLRVPYVLSTHDMKQAEELVDRILVLKDGKFIVNTRTSELVERSDFKAVKIFAAKQQYQEIIPALQGSFPYTVKIAYITHYYVYAYITTDDDQEIAAIAQFLEIKRQEGEIGAFTLYYNDFTDIICSYIEEEDFKFTETVQYEYYRRRSTFSSLYNFFAVLETKQTLIPFYVVASAACLLFVLATYLIMQFVSQYIDTYLKQFNEVTVASLAQDCLGCCGIEAGSDLQNSTYEYLAALLQNCPAGCYASATTSYFAPGVCSYLLTALGGDVQNPKVFVANDGASPFYTGQYFYEQRVNVIGGPRELLMGSDYLTTYNQTEGNITIECAMFLEKCATACADLANGALCAYYCQDLAYGAVEYEYSNAEGFGICSYQRNASVTYKTVQSAVETFYLDILDRYLTLNYSYCHVDYFSEKYAELYVVQQFKQFDRSFIEKYGEILHIYTYMPYFFGVSAFNDEFKANCSVTRFQPGTKGALSPLQPEFFDQAFANTGTSYQTFSYLYQDLEWHRTGELFASIGNGERIGFLDGASFELIQLFNEQIPLNSAKQAFADLKDSPVNKLYMQAQAYPYFATVFKSNSYAMFTNYVFFIILTVPFCFPGVKFAVDLAHYRENKHFTLLNYHNVREQMAIFSYFAFRIFQILPIIVVQAALSFVAGLVSKIGILYLSLYELIIVISSCIVGLFVYRCGIGSGRATFTAAVLLLTLNFVAMFLFQTNFFLFLFPYVQAVQRLQNLHNLGSHEWVFFVLQLLSCAVYFSVLNREFAISTSPPLSELRTRIISQYEPSYPNSNAEVSVHGLCVQVRYKELLHGISIEVDAGCAVGLLGLSGSGKTTTLNAIVGQQRYSGTIQLGGAEVQPGRCDVCFIPQFDILFEQLTVRYHISFFSNLHGVKSNNIIQYLGLSACAKNRAAYLSGGYRRRLSFAIACLSNNRVLACDEASTGLSPDLRRRMWALISARGGTQIITTHDMGEVESLCDVVVVMKEGCVVVRKRLAPAPFQFVRLGSKQYELRGADLARAMEVIKTRARAQPRILGKQFLEWIQ